MDLGTNYTIKIDSLTGQQQQWSADDKCFQWCVEQNVVNYNNLELKYVAVVGLTFAFLLAYEFCNEHEQLKKYAPLMIYFAKLSLYIFFFAYFVVLKLRLYYYG